MNLANYITFSTNLLKYQSTWPREFTICVSTSNISPLHHISTGKEFSLWGKNGRYYFEVLL